MPLDEAQNCKLQQIFNMQNNNHNFNDKIYLVFVR